MKNSFFWALKTKLADNCLSQTIIIVVQCKNQILGKFSRLAPGKNCSRKKTSKRVNCSFFNSWKNIKRVNCSFFNSLHIDLNLVFWVFYGKRAEKLQVAQRIELAVYFESSKIELAVYFENQAYRKLISIFCKSFQFKCKIYHNNQKLFIRLVCKSFQFKCKIYHNNQKLWLFV